MTLERGRDAAGMDREGADAVRFAERVELEIAYFPYVADRSLLPQQVLEARLDVVDPAWEEVVPANWRLAMRAEAR